MSLACARTTRATLVLAPRELTTRRSSRPVSTSELMRWKCPKQQQRCVLGKESAACRMDPMRRRRSSLRDSSSWNSLPLMLPSNGQRDARVHRWAPLKSGRWRRKACGGGSQGEWRHSGGHALGHRARGSRILRPSGGLSFRTHA